MAVDSVNKLLNSFENLEKEGFPDICRVCMCRNKNMKSVFSNELNRTVEELEFCTGILMTKEDGLPTVLCDSCLINLNIAHTFKTTCLHSNKIFRKFLAQKLMLDERIKIEEEEQVVDYQYEVRMMAKQEVEQDDDGNSDFFNVEDVNCVIKSPPRKKTTRPKHNKKKVKNKNDLKDEKKSRGLSCDVCGLNFTSKGTVLRHKWEAHGCNWICEICGKQFMHRASHYSHIRSHLPPKHACSYCEYKTWHKADLNKHIRIHTGDKHFVCEFCTSSFHNTSNLHDHIRRNHGGTKSHACPRCDHAFHSADKLRRHLDSHDNIKRHECDVCHAQFTRRCHWKKHLQKQHSIIVPRIRPGRQKSNLVTGDYDTEKERIIKTSVKTAQVIR